MPATEKTSKRALAAFHLWAREAPFNATFIYHRDGMTRLPEVFKYARKLQRAGLVCLFQVRDTNGFSYFAKRSPVLSHVVLDKVSAAIQVPPSSAALAARAATETL